VARVDVVVQLEGQDATNDRRLFADVEVAVAADLRLRVLLLGALFKAPDELHQPVDPEQEVAVGLRELELLGCDRCRDRRNGWSGRLDRRDHLLVTIVQRCGRRGCGRGRGWSGGGGGVWGRGSTPIGDVNRTTLGRE